MKKILAIKKPGGYLITDTDNTNYFSSTDLPSYLFDGKKPKPTFKKNWFEIEDKPKVIGKMSKQTSINFRWELQEPEKFPFFKKSYLDSEVKDDEDCFTEEFEKISVFYKLIFDTRPDIFVEIPFEWEELLEVETFNQPTGFSFNLVKGSINENNIKFDLISQIIIPDVLIHEQPCVLSVEDSYKIIRDHIKLNINPQFATITSDYDFCFEVKKKIELANPYSYEKEIFSTNRSKKRKFETRFVKSHELPFFNMAPKPYQKYNVLEPFKGKNQEDLKNNIRKFLDDLVNTMNSPLCECKECNGYGVKIKN